MNDLEKAETEIETCIEDFKKKIGNKSPQLYEMQMKKVQLLLLLNKVEEAQDLFRKYASVFDKALVVNKWWILANIKNAAKKLELTES